MKTLVFILVLVHCSVSIAEVWEGEVTTTKEIADDRSVDEVKASSIKELKMIAASKAGSYLIETETLINSVYSRELNLISSAYVSLYDMSFFRSFQDGRSYLKSNALAKVDLGEIERRVRYVKENRELKNLISSMLASSLHNYSEPDVERIMSELSKIEGIEKLSTEFTGVEVNSDVVDGTAYRALISLLSESVHEVSVVGVHLSGNKYISVRYSVIPPINALRETLSETLRVDQRKGQANEVLVFRGKRFLSKEIVHDPSFDYLAKQIVVFDILVNGDVRLTKPIMVRGNDSRFNPCEEGGLEKNSHTFCVISYGSYAEPYLADISIEQNDGLEVTSRIRLVNKGDALQ